MNAAIRSVVRTCAFHNIECVGIYRGYEGMIEGDFKSMDARSVKGIINKGGTVLKSARSLEFMTPEGRKKAHQHLLDANIDGLVAIGGDGTFTGAMVFNEEFDFPVSQAQAKEVSEFDFLTVDLKEEIELQFPSNEDKEPTTGRRLLSSLQEKAGQLFPVGRVWANCVQLTQALSYF